MHILVQSITGATCEITDAQTLSEIQSQIESQMGIPSEEQKLLLNGKLLTAESKIEDNSTLEGGAKGKKKKKDTKKGKKKHHKKKVKLAVLNYYKVEDDKVVRLKQMCKVCPPGTFIAEHEDRLYCGRCHTVYTKVNDAPAKGGKGDKKAKGKGKK